MQQDFWGFDEMIASNPRVWGWGSERNARRVSNLTEEERSMVRAGGTLIIEGCPAYLGEARRRVVFRKGRYYCRMP